MDESRYQWAQLMVFWATYQVQGQHWSAPCYNLSSMVIVNICQNLEPDRRGLPNDGLKSTNRSQKYAYICRLNRLKPAFLLANFPDFWWKFIPNSSFRRSLKPLRPQSISMAQILRFSKSPSPFRWVRYEGHFWTTPTSPNILGWWVRIQRFDCESFFAVF